MIHVPTLSEMLAVAQSRGADSRAPNLWKDLVGLWPLAAGGGLTAFDLSGYGHHGTLTNGPTWTVGEKGRCLSFDGSDDYIELGTLYEGIKLPLSCVAAGVVDTSVLSGILTTNDVVNKYAGLVCAIDSADMWLSFGDNTGRFVGDRESKVTSTNPVAAGKHQSFGWVCRGASDMDLYVDGRDVGGVYSGTCNTMVAPAAPARIGLSSAYGWNVKGSLSYVGLWGRSLLPSEIQQLYAAPNDMLTLRPKVFPAAVAPTTTRVFHIDQSVTNPSLSNMLDVARSHGADSKAPNLWKGLAGLWPMAAGGGLTAFDLSGFGNHGTLTDGPTRTVGEMGREISFDGTDDYINVDRQIHAGSANRTSSVWFSKPAGAFTIDVLVGYGTSGVNGQQWIVRFDSEILLRLAVYGGNRIWDCPSIADGLPHHVAVVLDGTATDDLIAYLDGIPLSVSSTASRTIDTTGDAFHIGASVDVANHWFGQIGSVAEHSRALAPSEIQQLYAAPNDMLTPRSRVFPAAALTNRYWVNDDADGDWHNANNWATTDGGAGGAGIPTDIDDVYLTGSEVSDLTLAASAECKSLTVDGYTGTIDLAGNTITSGGKVEIVGGTDGAELAVVAPSCLGSYPQNGTYNGEPAYERGDGAYWIWYNGSTLYFISAAKGTVDPSWGIPCPITPDPEGQYVPANTAGWPVVSLDGTTCTVVPRQTGGFVVGNDGTAAGTLDGDAGAQLDLEGLAFDLQNSSTLVATYCDISFSAVSNGTGDATAATNVNGGDNTNWDFGGGAISGASTLTFTTAGTLTAKGSLVGSSTLGFTSAGTLTGTGGLTGSSTLTFTPNGTLKGSGALTGDSTLSFTPAGSLKGKGALTGDSTLSFSPAGSLKGTGALVGGSTLTFTPAGGLTGKGKLAGASEFSFSPAGELNGIANLVGASTLTFDPAGTLLGAAAIAGAATLTFDPAGTLSRATSGPLRRGGTEGDPRLKRQDTGSVGLLRRRDPDADRPFRRSS